MKTTTISILQDLIAGKKYFSVNGVKAAAKKNHHSLNPATINQYLYNLKVKESLYSAGRGWYSSISQKYELVTEPINTIQQRIRARFPLLSFSLWSTRQLQPFAHHIMTNFVTFIFTDNDAMLSIANFLEEEGVRSIINPQKAEAEKYFNVSSVQIVLRPQITREPVEGDCAMIEKILIDLFIEKDRLQLLDGEEYRKIFRNLIYSQRINMAKLMEYAERRKMERTFLRSVLEAEKESILFKDEAGR